MTYKQYRLLEDYKARDWCVAIVTGLSILALIILWVMNCPVDTFAPDTIGSVLN